MSQAIEEELRDHLGELLTFKRIGLNPEQIRQHRLPTRPAKPTDKRNTAFVEAFGSGDCVELDALPPDDLIGWIERDITHHIDLASWARVKDAEAAQRTSLSDFIATFEELDEEEE